MPKEVVANKEARMQLRMTPELYARLLNLAQITKLTPHTLGSMSLAVGVNAIEQALMAATGEATIEQLTLAMVSGVSEDLDAIKQSFGGK